MHFIVKLSENKFYHHKITCKIENNIKNALGLFIYDLVQNSLSKKPMEIRSFFYNVLLRHLYFLTTITNYVNTQSTFVFIYHNIIYKKPFMVFCIVLLLEFNTTYNIKLPFKKGDHSRGDS